MSNAHEMIESCVQCGNCTEVCPFFKATGNQMYGAMAKIEAARVLLSEEVLSEDMLKTLSLCTRCDRCNSVCPVDTSVPDIVQEARAVIEGEDCGLRNALTLPRRSLSTGPRWRRPRVIGSGICQRIPDLRIKRVSLYPWMLGQHKAPRHRQGHFTAPFRRRIGLHRPWR